MGYGVVFKQHYLNVYNPGKDKKAVVFTDSIAGIINHEWVSYFHRPPEPLCQREGCGEILQRIRPHQGYWSEERLWFCGELPTWKMKSAFICWKYSCIVLFIIWGMFINVFVLCFCLLFQATSVRLSLNDCSFIFEEKMYYLYHSFISNFCDILFWIILKDFTAMLKYFSCVGFRSLMTPEMLRMLFTSLMEKSCVMKGDLCILAGHI